MQITLGKRGDYAVRAVLDLARHYGTGMRKARHVADAMHIPPAYLPQILADLVRQGILVATPGRDGGYELARPPRAISLLEVVEAAEGPLNAIRSCVLRDIPCGQHGFCAAHEAWTDGQQALARKLAGTSFATLAKRDSATDAATAPGAARRGR